MSTSAKHQTVHDRLREEILAGKYTGHNRFPSESMFCRRFTVSRPTVIHALKQLEHEGLVVRRRGSGTYLKEQSSTERKVFGVIVSNDNATLNIFPDVCAAFAEEGRKAGVTVLVNDTHLSDFANYGEQALYLAQSYVEKKVDGVMFLPVDVTEGYREMNARIVTLLRENGIPVVLLDCDWREPPERSDCDVVAIDNAAAGRRVGRHLTERGARRFVFLSFEDDIQTVADRIMGVRTAMLDARLSLANLRVVRWKRGDEATIRRLLAFRPDAFVCANDIVAALLIQTLQQLGVRIPQDVMVTGFDDARYASLLSPSLTTVRQPVEDIGRCAFAALLRRVTDPAAPVTTVSLAAPLIPRKSTQRNKK